MRRMRIKSSLVMLILLTSMFPGRLNAQLVASGKAEALQVKTKTLAVVILAEDEKVLKRLKDDQVQEYKAGVLAFNDHLKKAIQQDWTFTEDYTFISESEAAKLKKEKNSDYCILEAVEKPNYKMNDFYSPSSPGFNSSQHRDYHFSQVGKTSAISLRLAEEPHREIVMSYIPSLGVALGTLTGMVQNVQNQLNYAIDHDIVKRSEAKKHINENTAKLQDKTLLIFDPLISKGLEKQLKKGKLGKFYQYPCEKVSYEQVEQAIVEKNGDYAYISVMPVGVETRGKEHYYYLIIDAADGNILYSTKKAAAGAHGQFHFAQLMMLNKKIRK